MSLLPEYEADVERRFVRKLKKRGLKSVKLNISGQAGWHDRMIPAPGGVTFYFEFKRPGNGLKLTGSQPEVHAYMASLGGHRQYVFDDDEAALAVIDEYLACHPIPPATTS